MRCERSAGSRRRSLHAVPDNAGTGCAAGCRTHAALSPRAGAPEPEIPRSAAEAARKGLETRLRSDRVWYRAEGKHARAGKCGASGGCPGAAGTPPADRTISELPMTFLRIMFVKEHPYLYRQTNVRHGKQVKSYCTYLGPVAGGVPWGVRSRPQEAKGVRGDAHAARRCHRSARVRGDRGADHARDGDRCRAA